MMVDGLCKEGMVAEVDDVLRLMEKVDVKANELLHTTLIHGHFMKKNGERTLDLLSETKSKGMELDVSLYGTLI
jgi:pentatricopeptide repeat domain-containing protein 1